MAGLPRTSLLSLLKQAVPTRGGPARQVRLFSSSLASPSSSKPDSAASPLRPPPTRRPELESRDLRYLNSVSDLAAFDPVLDLHPDAHFSPALSPSQAHPTSITHINDSPQRPGWVQPRPSQDLMDDIPGEDDSVSHLASITDLSPAEIRGLYRFPLVVKRVVSMKSKGKMPSMYSLVVVGNGKGLVGVGEGKDETANKAVSKAFNQAVRSMDYVQRYEDRTVWGTMTSNFGSCKIQMRSRPPGEYSHPCPSRATDSRAFPGAGQLG